MADTSSFSLLDLVWQKSITLQKANLLIRNLRIASQRSENPVLADRLNGLEQISRGVGFDNITAGARIQGLAHHLRRVVLGDKQNFRASVSVLTLDHAAGLEAVHSRHGNVKNYDVGMQLGYFFKRLDSVRSFANNLPVTSALQQSSQPLPHNRVIVHQQDANRHTISNFLKSAALPTGQRRCRS
jgi:hypothetical protein